MKLKGKILALSLVPVILLGVTMFLVAADRIANGIYDEAYLGMHATALAVRDVFEIGYEGQYHLDENGDLWMGDELNISQASDIVDHIKENTDLDVTIFWGDTRMLTSLVDENGNRQVGTKASEKIADIVLNQERSYQDRHVEILGSEYVVYYEPFYQIGTDDVVGMIFLGTPQGDVSGIINKVRIQFFLIILLGILLSVIVVYFMANKIVVLLDRNMGLLGTMSDGNLNISVESGILERKDEIGGLGRSIESLKDKLGQIIHNITEKSDNVFEESNILKDITETVYQIMKELDQAAQNISASCNHQTEDSEQTSLTSESVVKISSATEIITSIASQTNLLSLNASIEAARQEKWVTVLL